MQRKATIAIQEQEKGPSQAKPNSRVSIFESILRNDSLPNSEKGRDRIAQEGFEAMSGGGETTSRVLAAALFFVLAGENLELFRLRAELATVIKSPSSRPSWGVLEKLPYLVSTSPNC